MIFETNSIYQSSYEIELPRDGVITPVNIRSLHKFEQVYRKLRVAGTQHDDFAIFATIIDDNGVATIEYLVADTRPHGSEANIIPADLVAADPDQYATLEMAQKIQAIDAGELAQFAISHTLVQYLRSMY